MTVLDPDLEQGLTVIFPWSSSGQTSRQCSFFELYEMCPLACSPGLSWGQKLGPVERGTGCLCKTSLPSL